MTLPQSVKAVLQFVEDVVPMLSMGISGVEKPKLHIASTNRGVVDSAIMGIQSSYMDITVHSGSSDSDQTQHITLKRLFREVRVQVVISGLPWELSSSLSLQLQHGRWAGVPSVLLWKQALESNQASSSSLVAASHQRCRGKEDGVVVVATYADLANEIMRVYSSSDEWSKLVAGGFECAEQREDEQVAEALLFTCKRFRSIQRFTKWQYILF